MHFDLIVIVIICFCSGKNITGYQRVLLKMRADHATSLLPNPIVVRTNESTCNVSCAMFELRVLSLVQTTIRQFPRSGGGAEPEPLSHLLFSICVMHQ